MGADNILEHISLVTHLGLTMIFSILIGFGGGYLLDGKFGTSPVWTIVCLIIGIVAGFWAVYKILVKQIGLK